MSDLFSTGSLTAANNLDIGASVGTANTGDLRRKYNFSDRVSELAVQQDPFFRLVSKVAKNQQMTLISNLLKRDTLGIKDMHM